MHAKKDNVMSSCVGGFPLGLKSLDIRPHSPSRLETYTSQGRSSINQRSYDVNVTGLKMLHWNVYTSKRKPPAP